MVHIPRLKDAWTTGTGLVVVQTFCLHSIIRYVNIHEKIDHNAGIINFSLAAGMLSMTLSALTVQVSWL